MVDVVGVGFDGLLVCLLRQIALVGILVMGGCVDNIMNIEPAMLLMVFSIPQYVDIYDPFSFLLLLADNYDVGHNHFVMRGLSSAFNTLVRSERSSILDGCSDFLLCFFSSSETEEVIATFQCWNP
ncbi:hypothetical protein Tsubulata_014594, partial [Turnera subulata]